jgi:outer membrane protein TolC
VPSKNTGTKLQLSLKDAIDRGLRYNLGLIESSQESADVRAERLRALSALLPQLSANARQAYQDISYKELGLKLPPIPGLPALPATSGGFRYQDARVNFTQPFATPSFEMGTGFEKAMNKHRSSAYAIPVM